MRVEVGTNAQHPNQSPAECVVGVLKIGDGELLTKHQFVILWDEKNIEEVAMKGGHPDDASSEFEVGEIVGIGVRGGVNLEGLAARGRAGE
jgi:hypothetical protein